MRPLARLPRPWLADRLRWSDSEPGHFIASAMLTSPGVVGPSILLWGRSPVGYASPAVRLWQIEQQVSAIHEDQDEHGTAAAAPVSAATSLASACPVLPIRIAKALQP